MTADRDALFARMPELAVASLRAITEDPAGRSSTRAAEALGVVGYPRSDQPIPLAEELTDAQRAVAEWLCEKPGIRLAQYAIPQHAWCRKRWLGLAPSGVLERMVVVGDGSAKAAPLWRALLVTPDFEALLHGLELRLVERLEIFVDTGMGAYNIQRDLDDLRDAATAEIGGDLGDWGSTQADRFVEILASQDIHSYSNAGRWIPSRATHPVMLAIARAGRVVEPRWDVLVEPYAGDESREILAKIPEPRRGNRIRAALADRLTSGAVATGLDLLADYPSVPVLGFVLEHAAHAFAPKRQVLARLEEIGETHPLVRAHVSAYKKKQPPPIFLSCTRTYSPSSLADLTAIEREQLAELGRRSDGETLPASARLDPDGVLVRGGLEVRELVDWTGAPAYRAFSYNADDGCIFAAGSTDIVASMVQHSIQCDDPALLEALQPALAEKPKKAPAKAANKRAKKPSP